MVSKLDMYELKSSFLFSVQISRAIIEAAFPSFVTVTSPIILLLQPMLSLKSLNKFRTAVPTARVAHSRTPWRRTRTRRFRYGK